MSFYDRLKHSRIPNVVWLWYFVGVMLTVMVLYHLQFLTTRLDMLFLVFGLALIIFILLFVTHK